MVCLNLLLCPYINIISNTFLYNKILLIYKLKLIKSHFIKIKTLNLLYFFLFIIIFITFYYKTMVKKRAQRCDEYWTSKEKKKGKKRLHVKIKDTTKRN